MSKRLNLPAFLIAALIILAAIYMVRPPTETTVIRQVSGTEIYLPYLGRTITVMDGQRLSQSFTAPQAGFINAVGVFVPRPNRDSKGKAVFRLLKIAGPKKSTLAKSTIDVSRLGNNDGLSIWRFAPIKATEGDRFVIDLAVAAKPSLMLFTGPGDSYKGGVAALDGRRLGVDLAFQVFYGLSAPEFWRLLSNKTPNLIGPFPLALFLAALWLASALWLRELWRLAPAGPEQRIGDRE